MSTANEPPRYIYIGRRSCGCCMAIVSDYQDRSTGDAVGEWIADKLTIERVTFERYKEISKEETFMECPHGKTLKQLVLDEVNPQSDRIDDPDGFIESWYKHPIHSDGEGDEA